MRTCRAFASFASRARSATSSTEPVDPVPRLTVKMGNGKNKDKTILLNIDNPVWETAHQASSRVFIEDWPGLRKLLDTIYCEEDLPEELISEVRPFPIVILNRVVKLGFRDLKESDIHLALYSARMSSADTVAAVPDL